MLTSSSRNEEWLLRTQCSVSEVYTPAEIDHVEQRAVQSYCLDCSVRQERASAEVDVVQLGATVCKTIYTAIIDGGTTPKIKGCQLRAALGQLKP